MVKTLTVTRLWKQAYLSDGETILPAGNAEHSLSKNPFIDWFRASDIENT